VLQAAVTGLWSLVCGHWSVVTGLWSPWRLYAACNDLVPCHEWCWWPWTSVAFDLMYPSVNLEATPQYLHCPDISFFYFLSLKCCLFCMLNTDSQNVFFALHFPEVLNCLQNYFRSQFLCPSSIQNLLIIDGGSPWYLHSLQKVHFISFLWPNVTVLCVKSWLLCWIFLSFIFVLSECYFCRTGCTFYFMLHYWHFKLSWNLNN